MTGVRPRRASLDRLAASVRRGAYQMPGSSGVRTVTRRGEQRADSAGTGELPGWHFWDTGGLVWDADFFEWSGVTTVGLVVDASDAATSWVQVNGAGEIEIIRAGLYAVRMNLELLVSDSAIVEIEFDWADLMVQDRWDVPPDPVSLSGARKFSRNLVVPFENDVETVDINIYSTASMASDGPPEMRIRPIFLV